METTQQIQFQTSDLSINYVVSQLYVKLNLITDTDLDAVNAYFTFSFSHGAAGKVSIIANG